MTTNEPMSGHAPDSSWTTGVAWKSPVVSPGPGSDPPVAGGQGIYTSADNDPGGRDDVATSVAGAIANAMARQHELQRDTYGQGSLIGDLMPMAQPVAGPGVGLSDVDLPIKGAGY
jgi:hypothetical protein